ncbi:hypothetical protein [Dyella sp. 20L07]|uniref:hypothetical protein n=1 Tax=Dyella sp. 20L07 TaxID=3384240 RepID=UPI003D2B539A
MKSSPAGAWLFLVLVAAFTPARAGASCVAVDVRMDDAQHALDITVHLPPSVNRIALDDLKPYSRKALWTSPDGSTRIDDDAISAADDRRELHIRMDVAHSPPRHDRSYAPFLRFVDGTVALYTPQFLAGEQSTLTLCPRYIPAKGQQVIGFGRAQSSPLQAGDTNPRGYVAFGTPEVTRNGGVLLVSDRQAPTWMREHMAKQAPRLVDFYTRRLGPGTVPTLFLFAQPEEQGVRNFNGDHLPSSLTLGLYGSGWETMDEDTLDDADNFLAHELFHVWNSAPLLGSPEGEGLLAKEGGAELARVIATASLAGRSPKEWLGSLDGANNGCLVGSSADNSIAAALKNPSPGMLPYQCGMVLMFAAAMAANPHDPAAGYFGLWRALERQHQAKPIDGYAWTDLIPPQASPELRQALIAAVQSPHGYAEHMRDVWRMLGMQTEPVAQLGQNDRHRYAATLMAHMMKQDCGGSVSFWNNPDGILLDKSLSTCHALRVGATVVAMQGQPFATGDVLAMASEVADRCARGDTVQVSYAPNAKDAASSSSDVRCHAPLALPPPPVHLVLPAS